MTGKYENDEDRVQWYGGFLNEFSKSELAKDLKFGSEEEVLEFINFAFDKKLPMKETYVKLNGVVFEEIDRVKLKSFNEAFEKMNKFYEANQDKIPMPEDE